MIHLRASGRKLRTALALLVTTSVLLGSLPSHLARAQEAIPADDPSFFVDTGYRIDRAVFFDFFQKRGGIRTFGFPISRDFQFLGCGVQFFQRLIMQQCDNQGVSTLNLLDPGLMPFTRISGSTFPGPDPALSAIAPRPDQPDFDTRAIDFVAGVAPDVFEGDQVNFFTTFLTTVTLEDAFPDGGGDPALVPLLNLELWGLPSSAPFRDPNNPNFVYQRFQRGIMHFDRTCACTQGLLLADYLKSIITGQNLPFDLAIEAQSSPLLRSILPGLAPLGTSYGAAFTPIAASSPTTGTNIFIFGHPNTTPRDLGLAIGAGFSWQKSLFRWRDIEGACKGCFNFAEADRVVQASNAAGLKIIARLDFQPGWTGVPETLNGPPLNFQDYWDFVFAFVSRYRLGSPMGQVQAIEIWNEPNLDREWGNGAISPQQAGDYVRLLTGAYNVAKAADPNVVVISAGLSPTGVTSGRAMDDVLYLQWLFDAGLKGGGNYDVLGAHANAQAPTVDAPLDSLPRFPHPSFYFRRVEQLRDVQVRNGDGDRQIWILEFGWTSNPIHPDFSWYAVSEDQKAVNDVAAYQFARQNWAPWIGVMTVWTFSDPSWTQDREEYWWAITNPDGSVRPAYTAIQAARASGALPR